MIHRSFDRAAVGTGGHDQVLSSADIEGLPFQLIYGSLASGAEAELCDTSSDEVLFVLSGTGNLTESSGRFHPLSPGDAVHVARESGYVLRAVDTDAVDFVRATWDRSATTQAACGVRTFDRAAMDWAYEMRIQHLYDQADIPGLPFGSVFGSVDPHTTSKYHRQQDGEIFLALGGRAEIRSGAASIEIGAGDLVYLTPFDVHGIRNTADEPFNLVSIYWDDSDTAAARLAAHPPRLDVPHRVVVSCPPPTPNGDLHLGHLAGPYLRADMFARALRTMGTDVALVTGTDDHQSYVATEALRGGVDTTELAVEAGDRVLATLTRAGYTATSVYRPLTDEGLQERIRTRFAALAASPATSFRSVRTPWCASCGCSLYQSFAAGNCPHCGQRCVGEICEACGMPNDARDLLDLACALCGAAPMFREEPALLLDLNVFAEDLRDHLAGLEGGSGLRLLARQLVDAGLGPYRISRSSTWGIALDGDLSGQVVDPWAELALTHLDQAASADRAGAWAESESGSGPGSGPGSVTFLGYDNSFYYGVLMPALAFATGAEDALPHGYVVNRFLHLDGEKFSTSQGHAVWADDALAKVPADAVRLALLREAPEEAVVDITVARANALHDPLLDEIREWIDGFAELPGAGAIPSTGAWSVAHREFYRGVCLLTTRLDGFLAVDAFSSTAYVETLESFVRGAKRFRNAERTRRLLVDKQEEARTSVALEYLAAKAFAALCYPVMPSFGERAWQGLGLPGVPVRQQAWSFIPAGTHADLASARELAAQWPKS
ncbi:methionyl-tRNA synthetase [Catenulispora sp. MAP12-49]|uniref:class I tRNA ligase family protein n=1 Tax=Catenulispora sp. MAP12-49 TaxID=3156302 RepID=UPI00351520B5